MILRRIVPFGCRRIFTSAACSSSNGEQDHYQILGLQPDATAKEVKAAYYSYSKEFHPDTNPDKKDEAAKKFHQVAMAYEVLSSDEKRKIYDLTRIRTSPLQTSYTGRTAVRQRAPTKQYTDIDIDYKNFEQFQKSTRRRRQFHSHFDMPHEFYAEFGGKKPVYKSEFEEELDRTASLYRDSRAAQREAEELRRQMEREQEQLQRKYPIPTFEQMMQERRDKERKDHRNYVVGFFTALLFFAFSMLLIAR